MTNIIALKAVNAHRWHVMHMRGDRIGVFHATAVRLCAPTSKVRYHAVSDRLAEMAKTDQKIKSVPWWAIAVISEREYGGPPHWDKQLGQGDPLNEVSHHDPRGRGPFLHHPEDVTPGNDAWTRAALDALIDCAPHAALWDDWTAGGAMTLFEEYNGLGYANLGVPSAYVWSGTDQYVHGKYVADHVYRSSAIDVQEGCAPILAMMRALDPSIKFADEPSELLAAA